MKEKGFTLIELIAVVVMMGMILLIVFPATSRLLKSNEDKKFDTYYDSVQESLELYARTRRDELGGIDGAGCIDDKKLSELKEFDYISEYKEEKNVTCLSPSDFTTDRLIALGIDTSKQYVNVRIDNNNGKMSVKYSMICVRNYNDPSTTSLLYSNLIEKENTCELYVPTVTNSLINEIKEKYTTDLEGTTSYVKGNPNNNYVLYSGKLWRIISFDAVDRTIKLVTDDSVALVNYNNSESNSPISSYNSSNIYLWLQSKFLPTLNNPEKYLLDNLWDCEAKASSNFTPNGGETVTSKVGMINAYEYNKSSSYLNKGKNFWLITPTKTATPGQFINAWYVNESGTVTSSLLNNFYGIRPSIVLKPNVKFVNGGNGTINNPYKLLGDTSANVGAYLNSRYPGEYVSVNDTLFRISLVDSKYTKLIATTTIPIDSNLASTIPYITSADYNTVAGTIGFHNFNEIYSDDTFIGSYLRMWASPIEELLTEGDFCRMVFNKSTSQTIECPQDSIINTKIAIPRIGDMYAINNSSEYWTINNSEAGKVNVISNNCSARSISVEDLSSIVPVIVINNEVLITGGNGTENNPYTIE